MNRRIRLGATCALLLIAVPVFAQRPTDVVKWTVKDGARSVVAGAAIDIELSAVVAPGWHLYALTQPKGGPNPLRIAVAKGHPFEISAKEIVGPVAQATEDDNFGLQTLQHDGTVVFRVPVNAAPTAPAGSRTVPIEITFQACGNGICLRPFTQTLPVELVVRSAAL